MAFTPEQKKAWRQRPDVKAHERAYIKAWKLKNADRLKEQYYARTGRTADAERKSCVECHEEFVALCRHQKYCCKECCHAATKRRWRVSERQVSAIQKLLFPRPPVIAEGDITLISKTHLVPRCFCLATPVYVRGIRDVVGQSFRPRRRGGPPGKVRHRAIFHFLDHRTKPDYQKNEQEWQRRYYVEHAAELREKSRKYTARRKAVARLIADLELTGESK